jgi:hypothetical protein
MNKCAYPPCNNLTKNTYCSRGCSNREQQKSFKKRRIKKREAEDETKNNPKTEI